MRVNFLCASDGTPLSKTFKEIAPGTYDETSYPHVANFISVSRDVENITELHTYMLACAAEGMCLLKGLLDRDLAGESRAGHTSPTELTSWLCLDVDYNVTDQTPAEWLAALSPEFEGVSFIFQRSASSGIRSEGWRGHFFVMLDTTQSPQVLKQWLIKKNLESVPLSSRISLGASGGALIYPLDVTTCQNDKLLYIAPPTCVGFDDPIEKRFELHDGKPTVTLNLEGLSAAVNQEAVATLVAKLRAAKGLKKKTVKTIYKNRVEIMTNPDPVMVTERKEARGFVYLNLNGGNSWAYYFPVDNPELLHNFKGEPSLYLRDVDKELYDEYRDTPVQDTGSLIPFGFLWPNDDTYYRGVANGTTGRLSWIFPVGSKGKLKDFLVQYGANPGKEWIVPEWEMEFDPSVEGRVDFERQTLNTYKSTQYMLNAKKGGSLPPVINKIITSVCVDAPTKEHFLNWIASIFQTRQKTNTAWIFQGVQGTGKGVLFTRILAPLLGPAYCHEMTMDRLDDDFNAYLAENILLFIDEAKITDSRDGDRLLNRIKNLVTEPEQHIRGMRRNAVTRKNYSNVILASNYDEIIPMEVSDRRFNVAPRQEVPLPLDYDDIVAISGELSEFAAFLHSYQVDEKKVKKVLMSEARSKLIALSETTVSSFFHAVSSGDLAYFTQYLDNNVKADIEGLRYHDFALAVTSWVDAVGHESVVTRNDLRACYQFLQSASISTTKFSRMCAKYGLSITAIRTAAGTTRGLRGIRWHLSDEERQSLQEEPAPNVRNIKA